MQKEEKKNTLNFNTPGGQVDVITPENYIYFYVQVLFIVSLMIHLRILLEM